MADTCASLAAEIAALKAEIGRIKSLSEAQVRVIIQSVIEASKPGIITSTKSALQPDITTAVAAGIVVVKSNFEATLASMKAAIGIVKTTADGASSTAKGAQGVADKSLERISTFEGTLKQVESSVSEVRATANTAKSTASKADITAETSLQQAIKGQKEAELARGLSVQAKQEAISAKTAATSAAAQANTATGKAAAASKDALNAATEVTGIKGIVKGIGSKVDDFGRAIGKLETAVGGAIIKAGEAVGISKNALAATGRLAGQVLQIFNVIGTIFTILDGMATREVLGARVDALEAGSIRLGNDISGVLGRMLQLKNRVARNEGTIISVRGIAQSASSLASSANLRADSAYAAARQAQLTADGAVKNAKIANNNATIAYEKAVEAKKQSNEALYETRTNKKTLEGQITALRTAFDAKIQSINAQISKFNSGTSDGFQKAVNAAISKIQSELAVMKAQVRAIKPTTPVDTASINANAVSAARALVLPLQNQLGQLNGQVIGITAQTAQIPVLASGLQNLASKLNTVDAKADAAMNEARRKGIPDLAPIQKQLDDKFNRFVTENNKALGIVGFNQSNLAKEFDSKLADFNRLNNLTSEQRFNEFKRDNDKKIGLLGFEQSNLSKQFDTKFADFKRLNDLTADQRFNEFEKDNKISLGLFKSDLGTVKSNLKTVEFDIKKIDTGLREQEKVNDLALPKLDQILGILPFIPARAADAIRPSIATIPQIEAASATGTCRTLQPGGCMNRALGDNAANITNNNNNNAANILDAVNTGANAALLAGQQTILARLGAQLPGGIGGKLSRFADWMHLDRVLNIMILAATVHNALMLSNDIGQTLIGAINNVLQFIGLKKEDGSGFDIGSAISGSIESLIKGAIGADNYVELKAGWAKANRIYQATTNIFNSFQGLVSSILDANEMLGAMTGKIGNALRKSGTVLEKSYEWFNPQPKYNRVTQGLEALQQGASTIQQVTQIPLDITAQVTELTTASTEFVQAIKEDDKPANKGIGTPEPDKIKADELAAKTASATGFNLLEIFFDEDE